MYLMAILISLSGMLVFQPPAEASFSCSGNDHYHDNREYKHDARYRYQSNGAVYKRWDVKQRNPYTGNYYKIGRHNVFCYYVDKA